MTKGTGKYITISTSDVATFIGRNPYASKELGIIKIWMRLDKPNFLEALERNELKMINVRDLKRQDFLKNENALKYEKTTEYKQTGTVEESKIMELFEAITEMKILNSNDQTYTFFINKNYGRLLYHKPILRGMIDGIVNIDEENVLVEIKDRQNQIFETVPDYEYVQVMIYMKMTKLRKCIHIQKHQDKFVTNNILFSDNKFDEIEEQIVYSIDYFEKVYFSQTFQDFFFEHILKNKKLQNEITSQLGLILEKQ